MIDVVDSKTRSRIMAGIGGSNTRPELRLRKALHALGYRYRLHVRNLAGKPDIVLARHRAAIFVHGCFWHRHEGCRYTTSPATRPDFWQQKFQSNVERDKRNVASLRDIGWRVAVVWECSLRTSSDLAAAVEDVSNWIEGGGEFLEVGQPVPPKRGSA